MPVEYEAKVLDIDPDAVTAAILKAGGKQASGTRLMRRYVYDITPGDLSTWIRLRDTGSEITVCVKKIRHDGVDGTDEAETAVGDFDTANQLLAMMGFTPKSYQENRRTSFTLDGVRLEIDEWPGIPPYLEIEGDSAEDVANAARILGYGPDDLTSENTMNVYARYGIDLSGIRDLRFGDAS